MISKIDRLTYMAAISHHGAYASLYCLTRTLRYMFGVPTRILLFLSESRINGRLFRP